MDITKIQSAGYNITYIAQPGENGPRVLVDWRTGLTPATKTYIENTYGSAVLADLIAWLKQHDITLMQTFGGFINEDPDVVQSIVTTSVATTRKLNFNGGGIDLGIVPNLTTSFDIEFTLLNASNGPGLFYLGSASSTWMYISSLDGQIEGIRLTGLQGYNMVTNTEYHLCFDKNKTVLKQGTTVQRTHTYNLASFSNIETIKFPYTISSSSRYFIGKCPKIIVNQDGVEHKLVPCMHNGAAGFLDLYTAIWKGNSEESGTITLISE